MWSGEDKYNIQDDIEGFVILKFGPQCWSGDWCGIPGHASNVESYSSHPLQIRNIKYSTSTCTNEATGLLCNRKA